MTFPASRRATVCLARIPAAPPVRCGFPSGRAVPVTVPGQAAGSSPRVPVQRDEILIPPPSRCADCSRRSCPVSQLASGSAQIALRVANRRSPAPAPPAPATFPPRRHPRLGPAPGRGCPVSRWPPTSSPQATCSAGPRVPVAGRQAAAGELADCLPGQFRPYLRIEARTLAGQFRQLRRLGRRQQLDHQRHAWPSSQRASRCSRSRPRVSRRESPPGGASGRVR